MTVLFKDSIVPNHNCRPRHWEGVEEEAQGGEEEVSSVGAERPSEAAPPLAGPRRER